MFSNSSSSLIARFVRPFLLAPLTQIGKLTRSYKIQTFQAIICINYFNSILDINALLRSWNLGHLIEYFEGNLKSLKNNSTKEKCESCSYIICRGTHNNVCFENHHQG